MGMSSDLDTSPLEQPITVGSELKIETHTSQYDLYHTFIFNADCITATKYENKFRIIFAAVSESTYQYEYIIKDSDGNVVRDDVTTGEINSVYTYDDKTVYWKHFYIAVPSTPTYSGPVQEIEQNEEYDYPANVAWTIVYGEIEGATVSIPVKWNSKYRTEPYEATFEIKVTS